MKKALILFLLFFSCVTTQYSHSDIEEQQDVVRVLANECHQGKMSSCEKLVYETKKLDEMFKHIE